MLLCGEHDSSRMLYHALTQRFGEVAVVQEERVSRLKLLRGRLRRQGILAVLGQVLFIMLVQPWLRWRASGRVTSLVREHSVSVAPIPSVLPVSSVNSEEARRLLQMLQPRLVVVNGSRIISRSTLRAAECPLLNTHAGITPCYRGVHGGYWALAEKRPDLVGTTVHYVDEGIDTGGVIARRFFPVTREDSFAT
ncbi:MAG: hypothetical protein KDA37_07565, partial [Planctomycetales bacterium]|nr:hypothetical protein [Planctomycetales bacterium]